MKDPCGYLREDRTPCYADAAVTCARCGKRICARHATSGAEFASLCIGWSPTWPGTVKGPRTGCKPPRELPGILQTDLLLAVTTE